MIFFVIEFLHTKITTFTTLETKKLIVKQNVFDLLHAGCQFEDVQMKEKGESR